MVGFTRGFKSIQAGQKQNFGVRIKFFFILFGYGESILMLHICAMMARKQGVLKIRLKH